MAKKNKLIDMNIERVEFPNKGIGEFEGTEIRVKGGIVGQKVKVNVTRRKKEYWEGKIYEILETSPYETENGCVHTGICGGCTYQKLTYDKELEIKLNQLKDLFRRAEINVDIEGIEASPEINGYRNKMEYSFGDEEKDGPLALGLHMKNRFYEVVNTYDCNIVNMDFTIIREATRKFFDDRNLPFYNKRSHTGLLRHLVVRRAQSTGEILVNLVTSSQIEFDKEAYVDSLLGIKDLEGKIKGILHTTNDGLADVVIADKLDILYGRDIIREEILGLKFDISPFSFFQTNTIGAEKLYSIAREFAGSDGKRVIFDLYSGTGTIAQMMSPIAKKVIGIEIVEEAVEKAKENALLNGLDNVEFIADDVFNAVDNLNIRPDLIILDPPRDGIHPKAINKIIDFKPERFVYISCNPSTLVRDLKEFKINGYRIDRVKCMDMFPRTPHVESIILMTYCGSEEK